MQYHHEQFPGTENERKFWLERTHYIFMISAVNSLSG